MEKYFLASLLKQKIFNVTGNFNLMNSKKYLINQTLLNFTDLRNFKRVSSMLCK